MKTQIINLLKKHTKLKEVILEIPPSPELGDYAFPCFQLAKKEKKNPAEIAANLAAKIKLIKGVEKVQPTGPYLNFFLDKSINSEFILSSILKPKKPKRGKNKKKIVIESPGPNTNKPLHLGHLRNMVLGISIKNLQEAAGNKAILVDIINDRGIHIAKSVLAYSLYGNNKKPDKKPDHFIGDFYVLFSKKAAENPELENEAHKLLQKYEAKDKATLSLFKRMNVWAIQGFNQTYKRVGIKIQKAYLESQNYERGREIVLNGLKKGVFQKNKEGSIIVNLEGEGLGEKVLLRADGTSIYITQDIYIAIKRYNDFHMDKMLYIVGSEQIYHFKVLFKTLELLGYKFARNYFHLPYGMVYLPEGKIKSREGKIVDADSLLDQMHTLAEKEIRKRYKTLSKKEIQKRSEIIAQSAIKFFLLKYDPLKDFTFFPEKSISFEGDTGPYIQYTSARASSILRKARTFKPAFNFTEEVEQKIINHLSRFQETVGEAAGKYSPHLIAHYSLDLAHLFNEFYHKYPVLTAEKAIKESRLTLVKATNNILKASLELMGIKPLEKM
ncbi:arginine--tRNA ligase [Candidatus Woesearchaeota archaeon]|nr:arginine--tRNA ligase [Candidatus Woesearchaeota archaeon]